MALEFLEGLRLIENKCNLLAAEGFDSEQMWKAMKHSFPLDSSGTAPLQNQGTRSTQDHAFLAIDLYQADFHDFGVTGLHRLADEGSFDGKFPVSAADQHVRRIRFGRPRSNRPFMAWRGSSGRCKERH